MNGTYISCPSCGNLVEQGASCDECATWREDNDKELAALKAEVETLRKEVGSKSAWATQMQKELQQERERAGKLARALNWIVNDASSFGLESEPYVERARQALLDAKQDGGNG